MILHTFGKDMKFHPHLHVLTNSNFNFNYKFNRIWRKIVLKNLGVLSNRYYYGYYVWSEKRNLHSKQIAKYVARYVRHPVIANGRIISYDRKKVTFFYKDNQDKNILITKPISNFIISLIQHIPPEQFKMIRYYGVYERKTKKKYKGLFK